MTTIREKLSTLYNVAREGGNVDAAELVALETQVQAEDTIQALAEEGAVARAAEAAELARLAGIATAQATARDLVTDAETAYEEAYGAAVAAIIALIDATDAQAAAIHDAISVLGSAGAPTIGEAEAGSVAAHPEAHMNGTVLVDGTRHSAIPHAGEPIRCVITSALYEPKFRDHTGALRRFPLYGGTGIDHKIGMPDWSAAPADARLW